MNSLDYLWFGSIPVSVVMNIWVPWLGICFQAGLFYAYLVMKN